MKIQLMVAATAALLLCACSKNDSNDNNVTYTGLYLSTSLDTAEVFLNGSYARIEWAGNGNKSRLVFDSVRVAADLTFTDNETVRQVTYTPPYYEYITSIGSGSFGTNTIQFHFVINSNGHINYSGIKK